MKNYVDEFVKIYNLWENWADGALKEISECDTRFRPHPPPTMTALFNLLLSERDSNGNDTELVVILDMTARFVLYLADNGLRYDQLLPCDCYKINEQDLDRLLN